MASLYDQFIKPIQSGVSNLLNPFMSKSMPPARNVPQNIALPKAPLNIQSKIPVPSATLTPKAKVQSQILEQKIVNNPIVKAITNSAPVQKVKNDLGFVRNLVTDPVNTYKKFQADSAESQKQQEKLNQAVKNIYQKHFGIKADTTGHTYGISYVPKGMDKRYPDKWAKLSDQEKQILQTYHKQESDNMMNLALSVGPHGGGGSSSKDLSKLFQKGEMGAVERGKQAMQVAQPTSQMIEPFQSKTPQPGSISNSVNLDKYFKPEVTPHEQIPIQMVKENFGAINKAYDERVAKKFGATNVVSADEAKHSIPGFEGHNAGQYHEASSGFAKAKYDQLLETNKGKGNNTVLFMSGGTGSGKTHALKAVGTNLDEFSIVYDTNLTGLESSTKKIQNALDHGYQVEVRYVQADPVDAFDRVIHRVGTEGRIVTMGEHVKRHSVALDELQQLKQKFGDNLDIRYIDNTGAKGNERLVTLDNLPKFMYNEGELKGVLHDKLNKAVSEGKLTTQQAEAIAERNRSISSGNGGGNEPPRQEGIGTRKIEPQQLNVNRLDLTEAQKTHVQDVEIKGVKETLSNKEIQRIAQKSGYDLKTHSIDDQAKIIAEQLNTRRRVTQLEIEADALKKSGAPIEQIIEKEKQIKEAAKVTNEQGTKLGRELQARKIIANEIDTPRMKIYKLLDEAGVNPDAYLKDSAKVDFANPTQVVDFYRKYAPAKFGNWIDKVRYNSMLSSPNTQIINLSSNLQGASIIAPFEKEVSGLLDSVISGVTGKKQQYYPGEGVAQSVGQVKALKEAGTNFFKTLRGDSSVMNPDFTQIPLTKSGTIGRGVENVLDFPMKLMEATDQFFLTLGKRGEEAALNRRIKKGGNVINPELAAKIESEKTFFRGELGDSSQGYVLNAIDRVAQTIKQYRNDKNPVVRYISKFTLPFVQVPTNILKQGIEYTPGIGLSTIPGNSEPIRQISKQIMGTAVGLTTAMLVTSDRATWGEPINQKDKSAFRESGMQPYSIKIGDKWVSYSKVHPAIAFPIALVAAVYDAQKNKQLDDSQATTILNGVSQLVNFYVDQSYLKNVGDFVSGVKGDLEGQTKLVSNYPQQLIPFRALMSWVNRIVDPVQRKADKDGSILTQQLQQIMTQIPGLSKNVPARLGPDGQPIKNSDTLINAFSPNKITTENPESKKIFDQFQETKKIRSDSARTVDLLNQQAEKLVQDYSQLSPAEANAKAAKLKKDNPDLYDALTRAVKKTSLTAAEKDLVSLGVKNGARARYIWEKVNAMQNPQEKNDYIKQLRQKKVITDEVFQQLKKLKQEPAITGTGSLIAPFQTP